MKEAVKRVGGRALAYTPKCPLGSLEWATGAAERVGVDPLADKYRELNKGLHAMQYVNAASECLPFADGAFDVVSIFNALDHVENADATIREVQRVLARGGDLLLICEIDHEPTLTEPQTLREGVLERFDACRVEMKKIFAINADHNVYASISQARPRSSLQDPGILCARLAKICLVDEQATRRAAHLLGEIIVASFIHVQEPGFEARVDRLAENHA
jgi:SAM-dependent methyltransferase